MMDTELARIRRDMADGWYIPQAQRELLAEVDRLIELVRLMTLERESLVEQRDEADRNENAAVQALDLLRKKRGTP